jgi:hypothetical protein
MGTPQVRAAVGKRSNVVPAAVIAKQKNDLRSDRQSGFTDLSYAKFAAETCKNCSLWERATQTNAVKHFKWEPHFVEDLKNVVVSLDRSLGKKD